MISIAANLGADGLWTVSPLVRWPLTTTYLAIIALIAIYGLHRYWLVFLFYRRRRNVRRTLRHFDPLPSVTVQLPMYNEGNVAERIIDAACRLDYPADRLQIQVLDDSTDGSDAITRRSVEGWQQRGVNIQLLHRDHRTGFKAGALAEALGTARGTFVAIFDADFVPPPNFLLRTIHHFTDARVGMVQARWAHMNRDDSLLTRCQAIFLDGHFIIEHTARNRAGRWINFNGTAGVWRRETILDAGSWQHDTLTEDVDLSYRAQLAGWDFVFLPRVRCPAELPPEINAFKAQQHRWTKGSIQTARKLLPRLLKAPIPLKVKIEAFFHLTSPMVYLYVSLMALLFYPAISVNTLVVKRGNMLGLLLGMSLFAVGAASASVFYLASQGTQRRSLLATALKLPALMSIGIGIALNNARGCLEALTGHQSSFERTPKYNTTNPEVRGRGVIPTPSTKAWMSLIEVGMGLYTLLCAHLVMNTPSTVISLPFLLLFSLGYLYVGIGGLISQWSSRRKTGPAVVLP